MGTVTHFGTLYARLAVKKMKTKRENMRLSRAGQRTMAFRINLLKDIKLQPTIYIPKHQIFLEIGYVGGMPAY